MTHSNTPKRVIAFIDGFNLYHSIADNSRLKALKWLDLDKLVRVLLPKKDLLKEVLYFTAYAKWKPDRFNRHKLYVRALETRGIKPIFGVFKKRSKKCFSCHVKYFTHEEKATDVNIAIQLFQKALNDEYDTALIISADSDLCPALEAVRKSFPQKELIVALPPSRPSESLKQVADTNMMIKVKHIQTCQLADPVKVGSVTLNCPAEWKSLPASS